MTGDDRFHVVPVQPPLPFHLEHWIAIAETHIALEQAIAAQHDVTLDGWINEWDCANPDEQKPEKRLRLYTLIHEQPRLVCAPDGAFLLSLRGFSKLNFYSSQ